MVGFSETELHQLIDKALEGRQEPYQYPALSYLEIELVEDFYTSLVNNNVDSNVIDKILKSLKNKITDTQTKISIPDIHNAIINCRRCSDTKSKPHLSLGNNVNPRLIFILTAADKETKSLKEYLEKYEFLLDEIAVSFVTRCSFVQNISENVIKNCSGYLFSELDYFKPAITIPIGAIALKALCGDRMNLADSHGKDFWLGMFRIFPLFSPMYALKSNKVATLESDFQKLRRLAYE